MFYDHILGERFLSHVNLTYEYDILLTQLGPTIFVINKVKHMYYLLNFMTMS